MRQGRCFAFFVCFTSLLIRKSNALPFLHKVKENVEFSSDV